MKKVQELAILCNLKANFSFFDPSINKLVEYVSDQQATITNLNSMIQGESNQIDFKTGRRLNFKHKVIQAKD